ncbi:MAG: tRNA (adenosine(37)-N6)-threonylcarbamoyltransferase complex ATPase subunit type 1 TsaE [Burkholderiaceae bacterium]|nr:tRNA (adenosine(37)-N6)-threonylcarbamoyltransferase complex ATPase subunit type 1 TsaE [Burkholderiaceae bacterium]
MSWRSEDDTRVFAGRLAALPGLRRAYIALHGDLGAGKTTLVRHLLRALGVQGRVKSPTYAVVEPYEIEVPAVAAAPGGMLAVWHFDFYRFGDPREWEDAGFRDIFASPGLKLAEWPEKAAGQLPAADLDLYLAVGDDDARSVTLRAGTTLGRGMLRELCP